MCSSDLVYTQYFDGINFAQVIQWFDLGGTIKLDESVNSADMAAQLGSIQGLLERTKALGLATNEPDAMRASAGEFILEGLCAHRRISRSEERLFAADNRKRDSAAAGEGGKRGPDTRRHYQ